MSRNDAEIIELFRGAVREVENKELGDLSAETRLVDLGMDSVTTMEVIGVLEERLNVQFPDEDLANIHSLADLSGLIKRIA